MVACQERTIARIIMKLRSIFKAPLQWHKSTRVYWKAVRWRLLQTVFSISLFFFVTFLMLPVYLHQIVCEVGDRATGACAVPTTDSGKSEMEKAKSANYPHSWLCWVINGKFITDTCFVAREQEVGCAPCRGKLSCASVADHLTKQENQSDRLRGSPSVFPC